MSCQMIFKSFKLLSIVQNILAWLLSFLLSAEQNKRMYEAKTKTTNALQETLGDRIRGMLSLGLLATAAQSQGRGYASTLVRRVTSETDCQGRGTWLLSSNYANTPFYESLGFVSMRKVIFGDDNRTWNRPHVPEMVAEKEQSVLDERLLSRIAVDPEVELLRYADVPRTVERMMYARNNSVLHHYIFGTPDAHKNPTLPYRDRIQLFLSWADGVRRRELLTVNRGDSLLLYSPAPESVPRRRKTTNKMIHGLIRRILSVFDPFYTKEQRKRMKELRETSAAAIEATLGQRVSELISIDNLVTAFEKQGLGYASTLVNYILDLAVEQKRSVWLLTNEHTVGFYARFGFKEVERYSLGEHNPTWTEDPVISCILLWEPESRAFDSETEESLHQPSPTLSALHAILWNPECKVTNLVPTLG
ncbi:uncharacterized protein C8Q71DRAFT_858589 [Rhodofomes roseus]|uniref:N-acetyltransferase domain-containing protein n=1 Tax=Rhodofomes roseus TaxID=34475 RepID=A0ABQ8KEV2_9APHY|nr:uncharacterized protein C8Q71DRAFT_858589 [Rhodofomes roseus]KAH9835739.1 hypothetical protein C8Q71DRAFT_858589 [Rhodofomes roseus]